MRLGLLLTEEDSDKLLKVAQYLDLEPLNIMIQSIDTLYRTVFQEE